MAVERWSRWTREEIRDLKKWFPNMSCENCARDLGRPVTAVKKMASRLGLRKSKRYLRALMLARRKP